MTRNLQLVSALLFVLLPGCALLLGSSYKPLATIPEGMGVVYIYDNDAGVGSRVFIDPDLSSPSAKHYLVMATDGYFPYLMTAGRVRVFSSDAEANPFGCVELNVTDGSAHWVSVTERGDTLAVAVESAETAQRNLGGHRRIDRAALGRASGQASPEPCTDSTGSAAQPEDQPAAEPQTDPKPEPQTDPKTDPEPEPQKEAPDDDDTTEIELI